MLSLCDKYVMSANLVQTSKHSLLSEQLNMSFTFIFLSMLLLRNAILYTNHVSLDQISQNKILQQNIKIMVNKTMFIECY